MGREGKSSRRVVLKDYDGKSSAHRSEYQVRSVLIRENPCPFLVL
jgi:hypothetical protein